MTKDYRQCEYRRVIGSERVGHEVRARWEQCTNHATVLMDGLVWTCKTHATGAVSSGAQGSTQKGALRAARVCESTAARELAEAVVRHVRAAPTEHTLLEYVERYIAARDARQRLED